MCICVCVCVSVCSIAIKTDTWPVVFLFFVAFLRPPLLLLRCLLLVCAFSGSESVARRTSCSTGSCCCCSSSSLCCCWPPLLSRLGCSAYLPQAFVVPVLPPSLLALLHFSPLSRFSFLVFKCNRKRILIFPFTQKTTTKTATKDTQAVFFSLFFLGMKFGNVARFCAHCSCCCCCCWFSLVSRTPSSYPSLALSLSAFLCRTNSFSFRQRNVLVTFFAPLRQLRRGKLSGEN